MATKQVTITLTWPKKKGYPLDNCFGRTDDAHLRAVRSATMTTNEWYTQIVDIDGDPDTARELLADCPVVLDYDIVGAPEAPETMAAYMQCRMVSPVEELVAVQKKSDIISNFPVTYLHDTPGQKRQVIGSPEDISDFIATLPEFISVELERKRTFRSSPDETTAALTDRQRELLSVAAQEGYYEIPRETTQEDLATILSISPGTVSEHLQRIEGKLAFGYLDGHTE